MKKKTQLLFWPILLIILCKNTYFNNNFKSWMWALYLRNLLWVMIQHSSCPQYKILSYFAKPESSYLHVHYLPCKKLALFYGWENWKSEANDFRASCGETFLDIECSLPYPTVSQQTYYPSICNYWCLLLKSAVLPQLIHRIMAQNWM